MEEEERDGDSNRKGPWFSRLRLHQQGSTKVPQGSLKNMNLPFRAAPARG